MSDAKEVWHGEIRAPDRDAAYPQPTGSIYLHCDDCASRRLQAYPTLACAGMALLSFGPNERLKEHSNG